jgi:hypothetical protein
MFSRTSEHRSLDLEIDRAFRELKLKDVGTPEYVKILNVISTLTEMKEKEKPSEVSKDTMATIGANLLGIFMIIKHEHVNVITSRAMSLLMRIR